MVQKIKKSNLDVDVITGATEHTGAAANDDLILISDTSESAALKKIQVSNLTAQAGDGLAKSNTTLSVDIPNTTLLDAGAATNDELLIFDTSAGALRSITQTNLLNFPTISSVSPTNVNQGDGTGSHTFTITGTGFSGAAAKLINASGGSLSFASVTIDSDTQITATITKAALVDSGEPYDVNVTAATGLASTLENQINVNAQPVFSTAAGSLGNIADSARSGGTTFNIFASDPESGGDVTYTIESGSLPSGMSGASQSSGFLISGTPDAVGTNTTSTFTIRAKDAASNTSDREFSITILAPQSTSFTSSGTFSVPTGVTTVDVLVVGGGGGGGSDNGGGGGAGGLVFRPGFTVTPGGTVTVTVGNGGAPDGSDNHPVVSGQNSVFGTLTAQGGGGGGTGTSCQGAQGGSGGGGNGHGTHPGGQAGQGTQDTQSGESGNYGFGNNGGSGAQPGGSGHPRLGGGGGGAGGDGRQGAQDGVGGVGKSYTIADGTTSVGYAGGGGGGAGSNPATIPASSGGGNGAGTAGANGTANRGGGAGGGGNTGPRPGGTGGKGVVIVRF